MPNFKTRLSNIGAKPAPYCARPERKGGSCRDCPNSFDPRLFDGGCKLARYKRKRKK